MSKILRMLQKDSTAFSLGRICALFTWLLWVAVTIFSVALNRYWQGYETLTVATFVSLLVQVCNKIVESKLFSIKEVKKDD